MDNLTDGRVVWWGGAYPVRVFDRISLTGPRNWSGLNDVT